jgi:glycosyltransferase involved in cell wall biosynthesis
MAYGPMRDLWLTAWEDRPAAARLVERVTGIPTRIDIGASARWLFISNWTREALEREVGLTVPDWGIAHSGVDPSRFPPSEPGPWRWRLLYAGRVDERKGIMTAVEALAELPAEATLVIQGGGDEGFAEQLRERSAELGIADRVEFRAPSRDTLAATYAECDALLFPVTWDEPWGLVPIEAMSVGRPVVATGTGGSAEYLRDGENCLLFEPGNAAALASAVRRLAESDELRTGLVEGGRATASHYTEDKFNAQIEQELLAARR